MNSYPGNSGVLPFRYASSHQAPVTVQPGLGPSLSQSAPPALKSPSFLSLMRLADAAMEDVPSYPGLPVAEVVLENFAYFPHAIAYVEAVKSALLVQPHTQYIADLTALEAAHARTVSMSVQPSVANESRVSVAQAAAIPGQEMIKMLPCHFRRVGAQAHRHLRAAHRVDAWLSVKLAPEHAAELAICLCQAFAAMCDNANLRGLVSAKVFGPVDQPIRSETGVLYLSDADPVNAATLAMVLHRLVIAAVAQKWGVAPHEVDPDLVYGNLEPADPVPGGVWVKPGISYSELAPSGTTRLQALARTLSDPRCRGDVAGGFATRLARAGYDAACPALAARPPGSVGHVVALLQGHMPAAQAWRDEPVRLDSWPLPS